MEKINYLASVILIISVFAGVATILLPDKKFDKTAQTLIMAVVLMVVITTIRGIDISEFTDFDFSEQLSLSSEIAEKSDAYAENLIRDKATQLIENKLKESNILYIKVDVIVDRNQNDSISIKEVDVVLADSDKYQKSSVEKLLSGYLGSEIILNVE